MRELLLFSLALLLGDVLFAQESRARDPCHWGLPDGALARLGKGSLGRGDRSVAYSPDGTRLAVATSVGIWLYDAATGAEAAPFAGHTARVSTVSFSPDGRTLASGSENGRIRLWDVASGQAKALLEGHSSEVRSVAFSPDGQTLASGSGRRDRTVRLWDVATGQEMATLQGHTEGFYSVAFRRMG